MSTLQIIVGNTPLRIDFALLRRQKRAIIVAKEDGCLTKSTAEGLLSFLDAFQDACANVLGDEAVFGKSSGMPFGDYIALSDAEKARVVRGA